MSVSAENSTINPALASWDANPYGLPPFHLLKAEHFESALLAAMESDRAEIATLVANPEPPTFENTILKYNDFGAEMTRIYSAFSNLCLSVGTNDLQEVEVKLAAPLASHSNFISTFPGLFERVSAIYSNLDELKSDEARVLTKRIYLDLIRGGAKIAANPELAAEYKALNCELAEKTTAFAQNVLHDESTVYLRLSSDELCGLPEDLINSAKQAAAELKLEEGSYAITLSRSLMVPFLTFSSSRKLRESAWKLWTNRGDLTDGHRNIPLAEEILRLRSRKAKLHGYSTFLEFGTADSMAGSPKAVTDLLNEVWGRAKVACNREREELEAYVKEHMSAEEANELTEIQPWDWRYVAEKLRVQSYSIQESEVKPYFSLSRMTEAMFDVANRLFGLSFKAMDKSAVALYHPDVTLYEVSRRSESTEQDEVIALFMADNFSRPHKRGGAWMSEYRAQSIDTLTGQNILPIIINNNNFNKPGEGEACLLSFDDTITLFHEFGHGLHGMLSNVTYSRLAGTNVLRDFVELPSQLFEHWVSEAAVMEKHAKHYQTNETIPVELFERLMRANRFHKGFQAVEYLSSALVDAHVHSLEEEKYAELDLKHVEKEYLEELGMPAGMIMRHRLPHFLHLFSDEGYAAAYYVYQWAEVLDADAFEAFKEAGDCFDKEIAARLLKNIYSAGGSRAPMELYKSFRGREPSIEPMLRKKGLL